MPNHIRKSMGNGDFVCRMEVRIMLLINEIFHSIQGEGPWSGHPSIFIRFSGCNLSCSFCDTEHESILHSMDEMDLARYLLSSFPNSTKLVVRSEEHTSELQSP